MASSKEYLNFILEQLSDLDDISYRPMMGEFILYYRGKIVGGIYDDRLLVKKTRSALELMPAAICELPYEGAKDIIVQRIIVLHRQRLVVRRVCNDSNEYPYLKAAVYSLRFHRAPQ